MNGHILQQLEGSPGLFRDLCCGPVIQDGVQSFLREVKSRDRGVCLQSKLAGVQPGYKTGE
jgi:hypothetical protein